MTHPSPDGRVASGSRRPYPMYFVAPVSPPLAVSLRLAPLISLCFWLIACGGPVGTVSAATCDVVASPAGADGAAGTADAPLRSAQAVIDRLRPGQTGCLRAGRYDGRGAPGYAARFGHGGRPGRPLTLRSFPGERATLRGVVYVPRGSDNVTISDLTIDDPTSYLRDRQLTVQLNARATRLVRDEITNGATKTCVVLGVGGARATGTVIRDSVLHDCGDPGNRMLDHAIYVASARRTRVVANTIIRAGGYAVHLYPDAQRSVVRDNVMIGNGGGVIFAGEGDEASSNNLVEGNVIGDSTSEADITSYWGGRTGRGNVARDNCVSHAPATEGRGFATVANVVGINHCDGVVPPALSAAAIKLLTP